MMRIAMAAAVVLAMVSAAGAQGFGLRAIANTYCEALMSGRMGPVLEVVTEDLAAALEGRGEFPTLWQSQPHPVAMCRPVGNAGSADRPETIISLGYGVVGLPNASQTIVMVIVDDELRIDDVEFSDGTTLRGRLATRA